MPVDKFGRMSDTKTRDTGVSLTYINNNYVRSDGSTPITGSIDMKGNTLTNVSDPVNPQDVATKEYADKVGGGEMAIIKTRYGTYGAIGNIDMRGYISTNVLYPTDAQDVATKEYVDNKRTHIIVAYASYHGDLEKDDYQFTFGGSSVKTNKKHSQYNGFMLPHSGYIKRLVFQCTGLKFLIKGSLSAFDHARITNNPIPLFTLVLIKSSLNYTQTLETGKINIILIVFIQKLKIALMVILFQI